MNRLVPLAVTLLAALAGCEQGEVASTAPAAPTYSAEEIANARTVAYRVDGMHCGGCAAGVQEKLAGLKGVVACSVVFETSTATVSIVDASVTPEIESAITGLGYTVAPVDAAAEEAAAESDADGEPTPNAPASEAAAT